MIPRPLLAVAACLVLAACQRAPIAAEGIGDGAGASPDEPIVAAVRAAIGPEDWPRWRGASANGVSWSSVPSLGEWDMERDVLWETPVPGRGHGSPIVFGDRVYVTAADRDAGVQSLLCIDRATGDIVWSRDVHRGGIETGGHDRASQASTTPATDGERIYVSFLNDRAVWASAYDLAGERVWQKRVHDYVVHQGYSPSPFLHGPLVIVSADNKGGGAVCGLRRDTGEVVWKRERPEKPNYVSPVVYHLGGRDQLFLTGCDLVTSLDPLTGEELWEFPGATTECVATTVTDGTHIYTSGGYPENHVAAVKADGSGEVVWKSGVRVYVPSMVVRDGHLYAVADAGIAHCWDSATGEIRWRERLGGTFNASLVLAGDRIHAVNEAGEVFVFRASPERFELLAESSLDAEVFATPVWVGGRVYARIARRVEGERREVLVCVGTR